MTFAKPHGLCLKASLGFGELYAFCILFLFCQQEQNVIRINSMQSVLWIIAIYH